MTRRFHEGAIHASIIFSASGDTALAWPGLIAAGGGKVYLFDWGNNRVLELNDRGDKGATFGRRGPGPGEFRMVTDMQLAQNGTLHLLDTQNRRITVLSDRLQPVKEIPLETAVGQPQRALPEVDGYLLYTIPSDTALVEASRNGTRTGARPLPWREVTLVHWVAREGYLLQDDASDLIVYAFKYGNGWIAFRPATHTASSRGRFFFDAPFPTVVQTRDPSGYSLRFSERATLTIRGAAVSAGCLYVTANDVGGDAESILDVFDASTGTYMLSYRIPFNIGNIAVSNDVAYALGSDPYPIVVRMELGSACTSDGVDGS